MDWKFIFYSLRKIRFGESKALIKNISQFLLYAEQSGNYYRFENYYRKKALNVFRVTSSLVNKPLANFGA